MKTRYERLIVLALLLCFSTAEADDGEPLKVISWNVLYGFNHHQSISQGIRWINHENPDVLALQELNGHKAKDLKNMAKQWGHANVVILKEEGFPVGLTSRQPIEVIERRVKGFHHGYLHCKTYGIHFFVVHFWPGKDYEAEEILKKIKPLIARGEKVIVCGDFNTHSKKDKAYLSHRTQKPIYKVVTLFESNGFVDLVFKHTPNAKYSSPSPITIPKWSKTLEEVEANRERIDFIFADHVLQNTSTFGDIIISKKLDKISDHYPVVVEFKKSAPNNKK